MVEELQLNLKRELRESDGGKFCLLCEEIKLGPFQEDNPAWRDLEITTKDGEKMCCSKSPDQNAILLMLVSVNVYIYIF